MKVLIINGSPRPRGNTKIALDEMVKIFDQESIESEIVHIGNKDIRGCIACMSCKTKLGHCVFDDCVNELDYILSVDIFSEGVDVPEINQVIMLRPTQSPIVFIQQLGRGLRKAEDKEYVVILDFI